MYVLSVFECERSPLNDSYIYHLVHMLGLYFAEKRSHQRHHLLSQVTWLPKLTLLITLFTHLIIYLIIFITEWELILLIMLDFIFLELMV